MNPRRDKWRSVDVDTAAREAGARRKPQPAPSCRGLARGEADQAQEIMRLDRLHEGDVVYFPAYLPYSCRALEQNLLGSAPILIKAIE